MSMYEFGHEAKALTLEQRIAQHEATIAELQRQQKTDLEAWCNLVMQCGLPTGHADDLQGLLREAGPYFLKMSEQLARMPVCVGYVSDYGLMKLKKKKAASNPLTVSPVTNMDYKHTIYIDPQPEPSGANPLLTTDELAQE